MKIELLHVSDCPHVDTARALLRECLTELQLDVAIEDKEGAYPSPAILVDGVGTSWPRAFWPATFDHDLVDDVRTVDDRTVYRTITGSGDFLESRRVWFEGEHVSFAIGKPTRPTDGFYRNAWSDELVLITQGSGILRSAFGPTTLAQVPMGGGAPRDVLEDVTWADWAPDGSLYCSDVHNGGVRRLRPDGQVELVIPKRRGVGGSEPESAPRGPHAPKNIHPPLVIHCHRELPLSDSVACQ